MEVKSSPKKSPKEKLEMEQDIVRKKSKYKLEKERTKMLQAQVSGYEPLDTSFSVLRTGNDPKTDNNKEILGRSSAKHWNDMLPFVNPVSIEKKEKTRCDSSISMEELIDYIDENRPDFFSFGQKPVYGKTATAYHAMRANNPLSPLNVYKIYTTTVFLPKRLHNPNAGKKKGDKQKDLRKMIYDTLSYGRVYSIDTATAQIRSLYREGMVLDIDTLIGIFQTRLCDGKNEVMSYKMFERWTAEVLEVNDGAALAYYVGILDDPDAAYGIYNNCRTDGVDCRDEFVEYMKDLRMENWN
jgi:hypothetical protein